MEYYSVKKPELCPKCGSERIGTFLYGEPAHSEELMNEIKAGKISTMPGFFFTVGLIILLPLSTWLLLSS